MTEHQPTTFPVSAMLGDAERRRSYVESRPSDLNPISFSELCDLGASTLSLSTESPTETYTKYCVSLLRASLTLEVAKRLTRKLSINPLLRLAKVEDNDIRTHVEKAIGAATSIREDLCGGYDMDDNKINQRYPLFYSIFTDLHNAGIFQDDVTARGAIIALNRRMRDGERTFKINTIDYLLLLKKIYERDRQKLEGGKLSWRILQKLALNSKTVLFQRAHGNTNDQNEIDMLASMSDATKFHLERGAKGWVVKQNTDVTRNISAYRRGVTRQRRLPPNTRIYSNEHISARTATTGCPASHLVPNRFLDHPNIGKEYNGSLNEVLLRLSVGLPPRSNRIGEIREIVQYHIGLLRLGSKPAIID